MIDLDELAVIADPNSGNQYGEHLDRLKQAARLYLESQRPVVAADTTGMPERIWAENIDVWPFQMVPYKREDLCPPADVLEKVADALDGYTLKGAMGNKASLALALLQPYLLKKDKIPDPPGSIHQYHDED